MAITDPHNIVAPMVQQSFLGASITNFSVSGGYNSNSTSLNVSLVEDPQFKHYKVPNQNLGIARANAVHEGYHYWDSAAFPLTDLGDCKNVGPNGDFFCPPTPGEPVYFNYYDAVGAVVFSFNGLISKFERSHDTGSGMTYTVNVEDPRRLLEGTQIILDKYMGTTAPADASHSLITAPFARTYTNGYLGYYNLINVFGYYEGLFNYGLALKNADGMPWLKVLDALNIMLGATNYHANEGYGGPIYYSKKSAPAAPITTAPNNIHRYKVDLTGLNALSQSRQGGPIPNDYRISGTSMSIMQFIQQVCDVGASDFMVNLASDVTGNTSAGIIKVLAIPRNRPVTIGRIRTEINAATAMPNHATGASNSTGPWADRVVSSNLGYEFTDPEVGTMMIGGPRTRVVGVTPLGAATLRPEYAVGADKLVEVMPSAEYDGAVLPGFPADPSTLEIADGAGTFNDKFLNWYHSKDKKDELNDAATGNDGYIDMYPCWGFHNASSITNTGTSVVEVETRGMPVLGLFHDDSPYRDFDEDKGIFSIVEYVDKNNPACIGDIYDSACNACSPDPVSCSVKRWKITSNNYIESPESATIPIDLDIIGYLGGPDGNNGDFRNYYYATVTELRHVLMGKESWLRYMRDYQPYLPCAMGWQKYCPLMQNTTAAGGGQAGAITGVTNMKDNGPTVTGDDMAQPSLGPDAKPKPQDVRGAESTAPPVVQASSVTNTTTKGKKKSPTTVKGQMQDWAFKKISEIASNFYGKQYLVPLPYSSPYDVYGDMDNWIRKIDPTSHQFELRWDLSSSGWAGDINFVDANGNPVAETGKRYPHNINFYDESGKLNAFVVFPTQEKMRCSKEMTTLDFGKLSPDDIHHTPISGNDMGGNSKGKTYVKASVDTKTYWILDQSAYDIHYNNVTQATLRPFALISIPAPAHWPNDDFIKISGRGSSAKYSPIPLGGFSDSRQISQANIKAAIGGVQPTLEDPEKGTLLAKSSATGPAGGTTELKMAPARYKPWTSAVPQTSNRYPWGPWAAGVAWGKAQFVEDASYAPENFGSEALMNLAARARVITLNDPNVFVESGSVTVTGLPDYQYGLGAQLLGSGPTVTDLSVDIGTGGVTTTYTMQTQQKFGELQDIYENRMKKLQSDSMKNAKELAAMSKQTKLISYRDLTNNLKKKK